ncbi:hypothetical protein ID866_7504 [Astraeus odoratus]|nr:hypothetical protein ID866_7504 [Astraeus odoratus]
MSAIGPQIPSHLLPTASANEDGSDEEDDYMPALPPDLAAARATSGPSLPTPSASVKDSSVPYSSAPPSAEESASVSSSRSPPAGPARRMYGPALPSAEPGPSVLRDPMTRPSRPVPEYSDSEDEDSDSEVGPQPLPTVSAPAGAHSEDRSGVQEFLDMEERRRKNVEEASKPKKLVREEWMLVPPKSGDLLGSLDPTKLKARQFGRSSGPARDSDSSLWTETPAERQKRLADEVSGRKRKAVNAEPEEDPEEAKRRRKRDEVIRKGVDEHTRKVRGMALVESHMDREARKTEKDEEPAVIWDHARDMSLGGRLMDEKQRQKMLRDAKTLGDRFGAGKSGGFL